jgi:ABC-type transport system involved in cytochrome bd biosynthesis fused ATPase/permease subunit
MVKLADKIKSIFKNDFLTFILVPIIYINNKPFKIIMLMFIVLISIFLIVEGMKTLNHEAKTFKNVSFVLYFFVIFEIAKEIKKTISIKPD